MIRKDIVQALVLAGGLLAGSAALTVARRMGLLDADTTLRAIMALLGLVMVIYANAIPKRVTKKTARGQAIQRLTGRAMLLAYLAYIAIWIFAPIDKANGLSLIPVLFAGGAVWFACEKARRQAV